jgi:hypothetical protein
MIEARSKSQALAAFAVRARKKILDGLFDENRFAA